MAKVSGHGLLIALLTTIAVGCPSDDDCDPYSCDCGLASASVSGGGAASSCVGSPLCNTDDECPAPRQGDVAPVCQSHGDVVLNGFGGTCILPCTDSCPGEMVCMGGQCRFVLGEDGRPCTPGVDCEAPESAQPPGPIMIPTDWARIESDCGFGFTAPADLVHEPAQGTDSCVDHWTSERCDYSADFGAFSDPLEGYSDTLADYDESRAPIAGRSAVVIEGRDGASFIAAAHVGDPADGPTLTLWVTCDDAPSRAEALTALRTITFTSR